MTDRPGEPEGRDQEPEAQEPTPELPQPPRPAEIPAPGSEPELPPPPMPQPELPAEMPLPEPASPPPAPPVEAPPIAGFGAESAVEPAVEPVTEPPVAPEGEAPAAPAAPEAAEGESPAEGTPAEPAPEGEAPATEEAAPAEGEEAAEIAAAPKGVPWWPFLAYLGVWIVVLGVAAYELWQTPIRAVVFEQPAYALTLASGLFLTVTGPVLILVVWLVVWARRSGSARRGLFIDALVKGAIVTLGGVMLWWVVLLGLDYLRIGRLL